MKSKSGAVSLIILFFFISYFHFYRLGSMPFNTWDEARLATSAFEMSRSGNLIITTLDGHADLIGTKPPLMIWTQAACIRTMGLSEFSIRFPAAVCAALTVLLVFIFVFKYTRSHWAALLSGIVLCTAHGYLFDHATRNGEYDSMLTLFTTAALLSLFMYTETIGERRNRWLLLFFFLFAIAALTKGVAALLFGPTMFIYLILRNQFFRTFLNKYLFVGLLLFAVLVGAFYGLREFYGHGYLQAVSEQELGGRFNNVIEGHSGNWDYYWEYIRCDGFGNWYWILPAALLVLWFFPNRKLMRLTGFCLLTSIGMLFIISFSKTKINWYSLPSIPLFAIVAGVLIDQMSGAFSIILHWKRQIITVALVIIFSIQPTLEAFAQMQNLRYDLRADNTYAASYYFRKAIYEDKNFENYTYLAGGYDIQWKLYVHWLNELGVNISCIEFWTWPKFKPGDKVIANDPDAKKYLERTYSYRLLDEYYGVKNYQIIKAI